MFRTVALGLSFCVGLAALAAPDHANADQQVMNFFMDGSNGDLLSLTHGGAVGLATTPDGIAMIQEELLQPGLALTSILRNADGDAVALASEIEFFPNGQKPGVEWETYWTLYIPGQGSLFGFETEAIPAEHIPPFVQRAEGTAWSGSIRAKIGSGPRDDGWGVIIGGTGDFEGATGKFAEFYTLKNLPLEGGIQGVLELEIILDE